MPTGLRTGICPAARFQWFEGAQSLAAGQILGTTAGHRETAPHVSGDVAGQCGEVGLDAADEVTGRGRAGGHP